MDQRWSLNNIYTSFDSEDFKKDMKRFYQFIDESKLWAKENLSSKSNAGKKLEEYLIQYIGFTDLSTRLYCFAELTMSVDAKNEKALNLSDELQQKITEFTPVEVGFQKWLGELEGLQQIIDASPFLKEHEFYLYQIVEKNKYILSEAEEIIISKMQNTGGIAWSKLQNMLTSTLLVDMVSDGEKKQFPLPVVRNMAYEKNGEVRKIAYEAELEAYKKIEESSAACINGIKGEAITITEMRGYKSPLDSTLKNSRMDEETLDAMLTAMREYLPVFEKYFLKKADILGYKKGLPFYDMFAPMGEADMNFTYEQAREFIVNNFRTFSDRLANFADKAFENKWIDAEPREGKRGGAFCYNLHFIKESRILSNFTGSFSDVVTLAHELGHGYHGECLNEESSLNCEYPMPLAETASIFCETIVKNAVLKTASKEEALTILEGSISDAAQVIVDIYSRYLFESELFNRRKKGSLSVKELKEIMVNAQKEAYGKGLDEEYLHPYMWVCKPHYYFTGAHFYNFPYAFGLLFAKGLYAEYVKKGEEFVNEYDKLLSVTGKQKIADVTKMMNIDIHSVDFWRGSLEIISKDIEKFIELA